MNWLRALDQALARASASAGTARVRQLRWVHGELSLYATSTPPPGGALWMPVYLAGYLAAADAGLLRRRATRPSPASPGAAPAELPPPTPASTATRRVRRDCLRLLATAAGQPEACDDRPAPPAPLPRAEPVAARLAVEQLAATARSLRRPDVTRAAAMLALVWEAGLRTGELAALTPDDLDLRARTVTFRPRPQAGRRDLEPETASLSRATCEVLADWLELRAQLTRDLPRVRTLWVSLAANHDGSGVRRPSGMPLRPNGIRRAHHRAVEWCNVTIHQPGYEPLPGQPRALRPQPEQQVTTRREDAAAR